MENKTIMERFASILIQLFEIIGHGFGHLGNSFELIADMIWAFFEGFRATLTQNKFLRQLEQNGYINN